MDDPNFLLGDGLKGDGFFFDMNSLGLRIVRQYSAPRQRTPAQYKARILHEYDHLVRMLGTSYGMVRYGLLTGFFVHFLQAYTMAGSVPNLQSRLEELKKDVHPQMTEAQIWSQLAPDNPDRPFFAALHYDGALESLEGRNLDAPAIGWMTGWALYASDLTRDPINTPQTLSTMLARLWGTAPESAGMLMLSSDAIGTRPLLASDLLEYLGVFVEVIHLATSGEAEFPLDLWEDEYLQALVVLREFVPDAFDTENDETAVEIEFALELALWPPVWPSMKPSELPVSGMWLIPSYRFLTIIEAAKELKLPFTFDMSLETEEIARLGQQWQAAICGQLGWPEPPEIARRWQEALDGIDNDSGDMIPWFWHHPQNRRLSWARRLLSALGQNPVGGALQAGFQFYGDINFPTVCDARESPVQFSLMEEIVWPPEDREYQRMDVLMFTASRAAFAGRDWEAIPKEVQEQAEEAWKSLMEP